MEMVSLKCPNCGASIDIKDTREFAFCSYCGTKVVNKQNETQKVKIENPIKIEGKVNVVNNEFEARLAEADGLADKYFVNPNYALLTNGKRGYLAVLDLYQQAFRLGANESKFYTHIMDFQSKALIEELKSKRRFLRDKNQLIAEFNGWLKKAIELAKEDEKQEIEEKYEKIRDEYVDSLNKFREIKEISDKQFLKWVLGIPAIIFVIMVIITMLTS